MTDAAKEYLNDIRLRKRALMGQLKELRDLERAIKAAGKGDAEVKPVLQIDKGPTLKDMILNVLHALNRGAEAVEIVDEIKETYSKDVMRSSLSPQLSRLKGEGKLYLDDKVWFLPAQWKARQADKLARQPSDDAQMIDDYALYMQEKLSSYAARLTVSQSHETASYEQAQAKSAWADKAKHIWRD